MNREQRRAAERQKAEKLSPDEAAYLTGPPGPPIVGKDGEDLRWFAAKLRESIKASIREDEGRQ